ncbi:MAG: 16S rRNA (cytidine(1402)-2'-O)-methyltransferase [Lachnospiraceae bacterium]
MPGILYLCATPIGNLEDITLRVLRILREADIIAAEDTRNTIKLLNHFNIKTPMTSYHEYNKYDKAQYLVNKLLDGSDIALVTDAGTPGISDPGEEIVKKAYQAGIQVTSLPGACACITALTLSGLATRRFAFEAFLPHDKKERKTIINSLKEETRTIIIYEAPHHLKNTLSELYSVLSDRKITICRELTKLHETVQLHTISSAIEFYKQNQPKGEYVLVIEGCTLQELEARHQNKWLDISIPEHMDIYLSKDMAKKEAMKQVASDRGISRREVYNSLLKQ